MNMDAVDWGLVLNAQDWDTLFKEARSDRIDNIKALLSTGIIEGLLKNGADPNQRDRISPITPLHLAVCYEMPDAVELLLERGADPNARAARSRTPLHCAVDSEDGPSRRISIIKILLDGGADPSLLDDAGKRPADYVGDDLHFLDTPTCHRMWDGPS